MDTANSYSGGDAAYLSPNDTKLLRIANKTSCNQATFPPEPALTKKTKRKKLKNKRRSSERYSEERLIKTSSDEDQFNQSSENNNDSPKRLKNSSNKIEIIENESYSGNAPTIRIKKRNSRKMPSLSPKSKPSLPNTAFKTENHFLDKKYSHAVTSPINKFLFNDNDI